MDVEASDDGVLAHIIVPAGDEVVPVGARIAVLAEPGEDLSSINVEVGDDIPAGESASDSPVPPADRQLEKRETAHQPSPSVSHLLRSHDIHPSEIAPTGPKGRLLKGDVLAHLGRIDKAWPRELGGRIGKLGKLDLSGVKAAAPAPAAAPKGGKEEKKVVAGKVDEEEKKIEVEVSFDELVKVQGKLQGIILHPSSSHFKLMYVR
jgi:pyruvate/2-oxoglutarate dehydrogenase complex dihydrolipoamide acyltransferase (E2) component